MFYLDTYGTLVSATMVLLLGRKLINKMYFLKKYAIPEPVAGGLSIALIFLFIQKTIGWEINFDMSLKETLMLTFFATIGLNASFISLRTGGKTLRTFAVVVAGLLFIQNSIGIALTQLLGLDPLFWLLAGSITLSGGHGTGAAWGKLFAERYGFEHATEVVMACATFGLILGGLTGGPVARYLVKCSATSGRQREPEHTVIIEKSPPGPVITSLTIIETIAVIALCLMSGHIIEQLLSGSIFELPGFVCVLFVGVILSNGLAFTGCYKVVNPAVSLLGHINLSLFLAMALMNLKLWELESLALPILLILSLQALVMVLYAIFVTWRVMGKNYDAAVFSAGHCGFGLGATPTAIANMQAITERFGPSHRAFLVVPMVGAFLIDVINAVVIKLYLLLPLFTDINKMS